MTDTDSEINNSDITADAEPAGGASADDALAGDAPPAERRNDPLLDGLRLAGNRRMPTLDFINDRFARAAKDSLLSLIRRHAQVVAQPVQVCPFNEILRRGSGRPHITMVKAHPLQGVGCWVVDPALVYLVVDTMFGGDSRLPPQMLDRDLSATELRILRRMMDGLIVEFEKAWKPVHELRFEVISEESDYRRADIAEPGERVLQCSFKISLNGHEGQIDFLLPFLALDPLKSVLFEPTRSLRAEIDSHWTGRLESEVQSAQVELIAVLAREEMKISNILALNVGDIIPIEIQEPITAYVDGLPMVLGQYGVRNGRYAIKVRHVKHPADLLDKT